MEAEAAVVAATTVVDDVDVDDDDDDCDSSIDDVVVVVAAVARGCEADTRSEVPLMAPGTAQCTETEAEAAHSIVSAVLSER